MTVGEVVYVECLKSKKMADNVQKGASVLKKLGSRGNTRRGRGFWGKYLAYYFIFDGEGK